MSKRPSYPRATPLTPSSPSAAGAQPKAMSSRLLTMKFMQRAAASRTQSQSQSGHSSPKTPITPTDTLAQPAAKRLKTSHSAPSLPATTTTAAAAQIETPTEEAGQGKGDSAKGEEGVERVGKPRLGQETMWEFSYRVEEPLEAKVGVGGPNGIGGLRIEVLESRPTGGDEGGVREEEVSGRRVFGSGRGKGGGGGAGNISSTYNSDETDDESDSDRDSEEDGDEEVDDDENGVDAEAMIKAQRKAQEKADRKAAAEEASVQHKQTPLPSPKGEVNLNQLQKISGKNTSKACHICGSFEHQMKACPKRPPPKCDSCGEIGHPKWKCPQKGLPY